MTVKRGVLRAFNAGSYLATVELDGSTGVYLAGVATSRDIAAGDMVNGRYVAVMFFEAGSPSDCVLFAVWGA